MTRLRLTSLIAPVLASLLLAAHSSARKDAIGVYGVVDRVVFEPNAQNPERIQVWGVFAMADVIGIENDSLKYVNIGGFHPARRGYLYYTVNPRDSVITRAEWAAMQSLAGTGKAVSFGGAFPPVDSTKPAPSTTDIVYLRSVMNYNGRLRTAADKPAQPDVFPLRMVGIASTMLADSARAAVHGVFQKD